MRAIAFCIIAGVVLVVAAIFGKDKKTKYDGKIVSSHMLSEEVDREKGEKVPKVNAMHMGANNLSRRDKSWSSFPDFVWKLITGWKSHG